jgi:hypothetical protein
MARFTAAVLDFVRRLNPEHLQSFCYFSARRSFAILGFIAGALAATAPDAGERAVHFMCLAKYRWVLRIIATGTEVMCYAVELIDTTSRLLEG